MRWFDSLRVRLQSLLKRTRVEQELQKELRFHLDQQIEENIAAGMSKEDARYAALRAIGNMGSIQEECRATWRTQWLESIVQDGVYAIRTLLKNPAFTAVAVTMLALGIGINAMVFTVVDTTLFKGFPLVEKNDRILYMTTGVGCCVSYPDFEDWRAQAKSFDGMAIVHGVQASLSDDRDYPDSCDATEVSADTFKLVGQKPILGRDFTASDEVPGADPVAMLSYGLWERRYGKDPAIIGTVIRMNGAAARVIGVMPRGFSFPQRVDVWVPLVTTANVRNRNNRDTWFVFGRLADGVTIETARAEMEGIGRRLGSAYPATNAGPNLIPHVLTFHEFFIGPNATTIYEALLVAVCFVLLIACANLANLLLTRAIGRSREISVRIALGAGRWRIVRQLLVESLLLSVAGGMLGFWVARWGVSVYGVAANGVGVSDAIVGRWFDNVLHFSMDSRAVLYIVAISIATGLLFGLAPALRLAGLDVITALKDGGRGATEGRGTKHLSALLVIGQTALAVVLLAGAGVMIRSFLKIYTADMGFKQEGLATALLNLPESKYGDPVSQISFYESFGARLKSLPGVESVAIASNTPPWGAGRIRFELEGAAPVAEQQRPAAGTVIVSPHYFRTLEASMLSGRDFNDTDVLSVTRVVIVNERFAATYWPGEEPIGKRLRLIQRNSPGPWLTVVGVASNIVQNDNTRQQFHPLLYLPFRQSPGGGMWIFARTRMSSASFAAAFRRELQRVDSDLPIWIKPAHMTERLVSSYRYRGVTGALFLVFAFIAVLIAAIGLYAIIAHSVSRRVQEIGVRMAIGATAGDVLKLVFRQGMVLWGIGLGIGLAASFAVNRFLKAQLVQVSPTDPLTYAIVCVVLVVAATLGCWIPARRAMRIDPGVALRQE
jgi:putative ABC transport system permease protein